MTTASIQQSSTVCILSSSLVRKHKSKSRYVNLMVASPGVGCTLQPTQASRLGWGGGGGWGTGGELRYLNSVDADPRWHQCQNSSHQVNELGGLIVAVQPLLPQLIQPRAPNHQSRVDLHPTHPVLLLHPSPIGQVFITMVVIQFR